MLNRGVYIIADDKIADNVIALLNSIRAYDSKAPIIMIPYNSRHKSIAKAARLLYGADVYNNMKFLKRLFRKINKIFGRKFFKNPNKLGKLACWFGPFDEFIYIDADIVVFERIMDNLSYLDNSDFVCCDYQYKNGLKHLFTEEILEKNIFSKKELGDVFNTGFWGSKKGLFTEDTLFEILDKCALYAEYFDFSAGVTDMPIINYAVLKTISRRLNIARISSQKIPGNWAGKKGFSNQGNKLIDPASGKYLKFIHWAGIKIEPGCPYWDIWKYYRDLNEGI